jgi:benzaldehyde dehydrogenase (NAD)
MTTQKQLGFLDSKVWTGRLFSNGWREAGLTREVREPATGKPLGQIGLGSADDIAKAAGRAHSAQVSWEQTAFHKKSQILQAAGQLLRSNQEELVDWLVRESGSTIGKASFEVALTASALEEAAKMPSQSVGLMLPAVGTVLSFCRRVPIGVVGVISPFNFPLYLAMRAVAPALATGNCVLLKPDPRTSIAGGFALARLFEAAGLPEGTLHVIPGETAAGEALCRDPHVGMIQFTGSTKTGRRVGELAGGHLKKLSLELGGKNSLIVMDDADLDVAASNVAWGAYLHQGQICMASNRVLVHRGIADELTVRLIDRAKRLPVGDPSKGPDVAVGPLISKAQLERADSIVQDTLKAGAKLEAGGTYEGLFYQPTVLSRVAPGMRAFEEELFAPVVALTTFETDEEAVSLANRTEYGLSAGVISGSAGRALNVGNRLRTGLLHINDQTVHDSVLNPFGGRGISGNGTNIGGPSNWEEFTQWQWVTMKAEATSYPF